MLNEKLPEYLLQYESMEKIAFQYFVAKYIKHDETILDICSGRGRTYNWIKEVYKDINITCSDFNNECLKELNKNKINAFKIDINKNWNNIVCDVITCFGGFNEFVDWGRVMANCNKTAPKHIFHFNRNDTKEALKLYMKEYIYQDYYYNAYSKSYIHNIYNNSEKRLFKIKDLVETPISYLVYAEKI
jgi:ubiquinone/menaquinone biosynthesis C-methylase UbiE